MVPLLVPLFVFLYIIMRALPFATGTMARNSNSCWVCTSWAPTSVSSLDTIPRTALLFSFSMVPSLTLYCRRQALVLKRMLQGHYIVCSQFPHCTPLTPHKPKRLLRTMQLSMKRLLFALHLIALAAAKGGGGSGGGSSGAAGGKGGSRGGGSGSSDAPMIKTSSGGQTVCKLSRSEFYTL